MLQKNFPIQRARMRLKLSVPLAQRQEMVDKLQSFDALIESSDTLQQSATFVVLVSAIGSLHGAGGAASNYCSAGGALNMQEEVQAGINF